MSAGFPADTPPPVYLSGLRLTGRRVLVVGGGHVAERRVPRLLGAGAHVHLVAPSATALLRGLAAHGALAWSARDFFEDDLEGAWLVLALTDEPAVNAAVAAGAEARHTFCVRADDATGGSAWTPAVGTVDGLLVGVIGNREPRRSARARDAAVAALRELDARD